MDLKQHHITAKEDKLPVIQKMGFGAGATITVVAVNAVPLLMPLYHTDLLKLSPILIGLVSFWPRIWDAITDPLVGNISDNTRSRFGRRIPYIFVGGIIVGAAFALLFMVPEGWSKYMSFAYILFVLLLFYTGITIFTVPHGALGFEMSDDYHERTSVFVYFAFIGNIAAFILPSIYFLANLAIFKTPLNGMKWVCTGFGIVFTLSAIICAVLCKETKIEEVKKQEKAKLLESFLATCKNRTFVMLLAAFVLVILGFHIVSGFNGFIMIYYIFSGDKAEASKFMMYNGWLWAAVSLAGVSQMARISRLIGKTNMVIFAFSIITVGQLLKIVCYNQTYPLLTLIPTACLALGMVICFSIVYSMTADICDEDDLKTGKRREGMYYAIYGWWTKLAMSMAILICGFLLKYTGYDANFAQQTDSTMFWLRFYEIGLPAALCVVAIVILTRYPLTENRAYEVKALLEERRKDQDNP